MIRKPINLNIEPRGSDHKTPYLQLIPGGIIDNYQTLNHPYVNTTQDTYVTSPSIFAFKPKDSERDLPESPVNEIDDSNLSTYKRIRLGRKGKMNTQPLKRKTE
jgi:hypothetical protein